VILVFNKYKSFACFHSLFNYYPAIYILMRSSSHVIFRNIVPHWRWALNIAKSQPLINRTLEFSRSLESLYSAVKPMHSPSDSQWEKELRRKEIRKKRDKKNSSGKVRGKRSVHTSRVGGGKVLAISRVDTRASGRY